MFPLFCGQDEQSPGWWQWLPPPLSMTFTSITGNTACSRRFCSRCLRRASASSIRAISSPAARQSSRNVSTFARIRSQSFMVCLLCGDVGDDGGCERPHPRDKQDPKDGEDGEYAERFE